MTNVSFFYFFFSSLTSSMRFRELEIYKNVIGFSGDPAKIPPIWMCSYFNKAIIALGSSEFSRARILGESVPHNMARMKFSLQLNIVKITFTKSVFFKYLLDFYVIASLIFKWKLHEGLRMAFGEGLSFLSW